MIENRLIIFSKWLELGKCKSRIAQEEGDEFACNFSHACLRDLLSNLKEVSYKIIFGVDNEKEAELFKRHYGHDSRIVSSRAKSISDKFNSLFTSISEESKKVVLIPMDLPFLQEEEVVRSFEELDDSNYVLGPENNGGIYLMGSKSPYTENIFKGVQWSTSQSSQDFIANCRRRKVSILPMKNDLNTRRDIQENIEKISCYCPNLLRLLQTIPHYSSRERELEVYV